MKYLGDTVHDVVTQVVQLSNVRRVVENPRKEESLLSNLCLKLNAKLDGVNAKVIDGNTASPAITFRNLDKKSLCVLHYNRFVRPTVCMHTYIEFHPPNRLVGRSVLPVP